MSAGTLRKAAIDDVITLFRIHVYYVYTYNRATIYAIHSTSLSSTLGPQELCEDLAAIRRIDGESLFVFVRYRIRISGSRDFSIATRVTRTRDKRNFAAFIFYERQLESDTARAVSFIRGCTTYCLVIEQQTHTPPKQTIANTFC